MRKLILSTTLALLISAPTFAQSKKELAAQDLVLAERIARLEARMLTGDPAAEQLMQRMDALETEQRSLTGEIEQLRFERDNLKAEISALSQDLEMIEALSDRMSTHLDAVDMVASQRPVTSTPSMPSSGTIISNGPEISGSSQPSMVPSAPSSREVNLPMGSVPPPSSLDDLPETGKQKLYEGNFSGAQSDFLVYLAAVPDAPNAGEVSFWLGETYYVKSGFADAADAYIESIRKDPQGDKAPEALIRLAASLRELGQTGKACEALDSFPVQFPRADAEIREKARIELARTGC
ncbi:MAG: hypothetical protein HKN36_03460 [Hellea sp.]|nr:hypothetical protein [Hellea sp.]